jgi:hypothetical protein
MAERSWPGFAQLRVFMVSRGSAMIWINDRPKAHRKLRRHVQRNPRTGASSLRIAVRGRSSLRRDIIAVLVFKLAALFLLYLLFFTPRAPFEPTAARLAAILLGPAAAGSN